MTLKYIWEYQIAPAPVIEKFNDKKFIQHWLKYICYNNQGQSLKLPVKGDFIDVPIFGMCQIDRIYPKYGEMIKRGHEFIVNFSWKSIGNKRIWEQIPNYPVYKSGNIGRSQWKFNLLSERDKEVFRDLDIPQSKWIKLPKKVTDNPNQIWWSRIIDDSNSWAFVGGDFLKYKFN